MTPVDLKVLLHCYYTTEACAGIKTQPIQDSIEKFLLNNIFEATGSQFGYLITGKGHVFLKMICLTPFPEIAWVNPKSKLRVA